MNELPTVLGIAPFVPVVILCYFVGAGFKAINNETLDKFIPEIVAVFGGIVTTVLFTTINGYIPATNWFEAFILGMVSGAVAVYVNQIYKQFTKEEYFEKDTEEDLPIDEGEAEDTEEKEG